MRKEEKLCSCIGHAMLLQESLLAELILVSRENMACDEIQPALFVNIRGV